MKRKLFWMLVIGFGVAYAANHTRIGKNVVTVVGRTVDSVNDGFGTDVELGTLKRELRNLEKEQAKIQGRYATAKVDAERLAKQVAQQRGDLEKSEQALVQKGEELKKAGDNSRVSWNGINISIREGKERLQIAVDQYKAKKATLAADEQRLAYLEKDRDILAAQLSTFKAEVARMNDDLERMQSELNLLKLEQSRQRKYPANTDLSEVKEAFESLSRKIAIEREKLNLTTGGATSEASGKSVDEILKQIAESTTMND